MNEEFLKRKEEKVTAGLKNFQKATVDRIDYLFRHGSKRVLVADEVGLGKTIIARGCIAKTGVLRAEEGDNLFKVVYVCSNQNIARKNIEKLDIYNESDDEVNDVEKEVNDVEKEKEKKEKRDQIQIQPRYSDSRLSMQHLRIVEQEIDCEQKDLQTQLIPLTPNTSFYITSGGGTVEERALIFQILRRMPQFKGLEEGLERRFSWLATKGWYSWARDHYEKRVALAEAATIKANWEDPYPQSIISAIQSEEEYIKIIDRLVDIIKKDEDIHTDFISEIRRMFARISVKRLQPDLVIMDEFQRFKSLLSDEISEIGIIAHEFLNQRDTRVLLLSATPYRLYNTLEEIENQPDDDHYKEFIQVMNFLFKDPVQRNRFRSAWDQYSESLQFLRQNGIEVVKAKKEEAEKELYRGMCRTERLSVMKGEDFIDSESITKSLEVTQEDIRSYVEGCQFLEDIQGRGNLLPMDYAKSCPFLLSFMSNYKLMDRLEVYFKKNPDMLKGRKGLLWLNSDRINNYEPLPKSNARLELLKKHLFQDQQSHLFLWIPPSLHYYNLEGVYKDSRPFSKILLFSAWEMVPKMISTLISYEAERLTVGEIAKSLKDKKSKRNAHYFTKGENRYPQGRITGDSAWYMLYPSKRLSSLYNPIESFNQKQTLSEIYADIKSTIEVELAKMQRFITKDKGIDDHRWYLVAPIYMDAQHSQEHVKQWLESFEKIVGDKTIAEMLKEFKAAGDFDLSTLNLGRQPDNLAQVMTWMSIGSPINCIYRSNGQNIKRAVEMAQMFINRFNTTEATAVIEQAYNQGKKRTKKKDTDKTPHWIKLLKYCVEGCFQAMFDEYRHMIADEVKFRGEKDLEDEIHSKMCGEDDKSGTLRIRVRNYSIETPENLRQRLTQGSSRSNRTNMRGHFAVGFTKSKSTKDSESKESIQDAFNSPLRPFVLASTSIGQEGLDFHYYCRKIMHWNLPCNPIDLEQREGRVNRFKCLAIRQNLAEYYKDAHFKEDVWNEIFDMASRDLLKPGDSELTPYWCLGSNQKIKIERIVPMYPLSKDQERYSRLIKILSLYRMTMGQARQEELIQYLLDSDCDKSQLESLFMDLSPFNHLPKQSQT